MRHRKGGRRLGMPMHRRKAMMKQLVEALFLHGRIKTTLARAKETRSLAEKMVTLAKKGSLHHRRQAMALINRKDVVNRLFDHIAAWYKERQGGYTRIIKIGNRAGDAASVAFLELVDWIPGEKLVGQLTKLEKSETGEDGGKTDKDKDKDKEKAKKKKDEKKKDEKKAKPVVKKKVSKVVKSAEKEKKISERKAEKDKVKKERAADRDKAKKENTDKKAKTKAETKKVVKQAKKVMKKAKKKVVKKKSS